MCRLSTVISGTSFLYNSHIFCRLFTIFCLTFSATEAIYNAFVPRNLEEMLFGASNIGAMSAFACYLSNLMSYYLSIFLLKQEFSRSIKTNLYLFLFSDSGEKKSY